MNLVAIVILLAVLEFMIFGYMVGYARGKYGVKAPATSGNEIFERHFRVHYNTLEQLIVFVPSIWFFGQYVSAMWASILGVVYLLGRVLYATSYVKDPAKRSAGFGLSSLPTTALLLGALYGAVRAALG